jgi:hypothetical protein
MNRRRLLWGVGATGIAALTGTAGYAAREVRTPTQRAAVASPPPPSRVTVPVRRGELADEVALEGVLGRANGVDIAVPAQVDGASRVIVTRLPVKQEQEVYNGQVLAETSGRPVILLSGEYPSYRDLTRGIEGPDVAQLQRALRLLFNTPVTGAFDLRTEADLTRLYQRAKYKPLLRDSKVVLPLGEVAFVPHLPAQVSALGARVGDTKGSLMSLASGAWHVVATTDREIVGVLGGKPVLRFGPGPFDGKDTKFVETRQRPPKDDSKEPVTEAVFSAPEGADATIGTRQEVLITKARSANDALIVPVSALWTAKHGTVSVTAVRGTTTRTVEVTVKLTVKGQCAVTGDLAEGDHVEVHGK